MLYMIKNVELTENNINTLLTCIDIRMRELREMCEKSTMLRDKNHFRGEYARLSAVRSKIENTNFELIDIKIEEE